MDKNRKQRETRKLLTREEPSDTKESIQYQNPPAGAALDEIRHICIDEIKKSGIVFPELTAGGRIKVLPVPTITRVLSFLFLISHSSHAAGTVPSARVN